MYEYTDQNGVTYWSFTKHPRPKTPPIQLQLNDRVGTHFTNFVNELRNLHRYLTQSDDQKTG
jgi:hypothetical protein